MCENGCGNHFPFAVEPAADGIDARLDQIADHRQRAHHVAVERAIAHGHLRLVAGGEHQGAELVRERHQQRAANARLDVLLGDVFLHSGKERAPALRLNSAKSALMDDDFKANAEVGGQLRLSSMEPAEE